MRVLAALGSSPSPASRPVSRASAASACFRVSAHHHRVVERSGPARRARPSAMPGPAGAGRRCRATVKVGPPCGVPDALRRSDPPSITPARSSYADQGQDGPVADAFLDGLHQPVMRNRRKAVGDVGLHDPAAAPPGLINEYLQGIVRRAPRAEPEAARQKVRLEDRLEHDLRGSLHDPVADSRRSTAACCSLEPGFGMNTRRAGSGRYRSSSSSSAASSPSSRDTPYSSASAKAGHGQCPAAPRLRRTSSHALPKHILAADLAGQRMEPSVRIGLGRPVKHMLQRADPVPTDSRQGGPSRTSGTHRSGPSNVRVNEAAALPITGRLCCPAARPVLRPPPTPSRRPAHFPAPHRL